MQQPTSLLGLTSDELLAVARERIGRGAGFAAAVHRQAVHTGGLDPAALGAGPAVAARWHEHFAAERPKVVQTAVEEGPLGNPTIKAGLRLHDGSEIECVRIGVGRDRSSLCISSQVGCRRACRFCETARMGLVRDLSAAEIVGQVVAARVDLGWTPDTIVFMGMGEPLDNLDAVVEALHVLTDRRGLAFAHDRITVCTVGRVAGIDRLAALGWKRLNLAFSLTAADDALRRQIVPTHRDETLADLGAALQRYRQRRNLELSIHYCLLPGINDSPADAHAVATFCAPLGRTVVHVIPYNPGSRPLTRAPTLPAVEAFVAHLRDRGLMVRRRITKGRSVSAACGQLRREA